MRSLRNRLVVATLAATFVILLVAACFIFWLIRGTLLAEFDDTLLAKARALASLAEQDGDRFELELDAGQMPEFGLVDRPEYFQLWSANGSTLARSVSLSADSLDARGSTKWPSYRLVELPDDRPGRQVTVDTSIRSDGDAGTATDGQAGRPSHAAITICVARDTLDLDRTLWRLALLLGSVSLGAAIVSVVVMTLAVNVTLKPVGLLAAQISVIDAAKVLSGGQLSNSIAELDPVVQRLNALLKRLDKALTREKAFTAEVAHELRTPLAGLSAALEVCVSKPRDEQAYRDVIQKCLGATRTMQAMVENLLTLARADAGQLTLKQEPLDLIEFATDCWSCFAEQAENQELAVKWPDAADRITIVTDREKLRLVLFNLFDNSVRHVDRGGTVSVDAVHDATTVTYTIRNSGCDLSPADLENVFETFWKYDAARSAGAEHCGLGLPLCRKIAKILGGSITATIANRFFVVTLKLPLGTEKILRNTQ